MKQLLPQLPKQILLTHKLLVINILCLVSGCKSINEIQSKSDYQDIIESQIVGLESRNDYTGDVRLNIEFIEALEFKRFLKERMFSDTVTYMRPHRIFTEEQAISFFKGENGNFLIEQLENKKIALKKVVPKNYKNKLFDFEKIKNNLKQGDMATYDFYFKRQVYIGVPLFSKNGKYALIYYLDGYYRHAESGYFIYEKTNGKWKFAKADILGIS